MRLGLSGLVAPLAVVYVAFGIVFGVLSRPALAGAPTDRPGLVDTTSHPSQPLQSATLSELKSELDQIDRLAVLEAIHVGLTDAPDGSTYMWRRHNGKIAGSVRPTNSFRDSHGKVCRFLVFQLLLGEHMRQIEGIACRQDDRSWLLEG
jgi:surface antigen